MISSCSILFLNRPNHAKQLLFRLPVNAMLAKRGKLNQGIVTNKNFVGCQTPGRLPTALRQGRTWVVRFSWAPTAQMCNSMLSTTLREQASEAVGRALRMKAQILLPADSFEFAPAAGPPMPAGRTPCHCSHALPCQIESTRWHHHVGVEIDCRPVVASLGRLAASTLMPMSACCKPEQGRTLALMGSHWLQAGSSNSLVEGDMADSTRAARMTCLGAGMRQHESLAPVCWTRAFRRVAAAHTDMAVAASGMLATEHTQWQDRPCVPGADFETAGCQAPATLAPAKQAIRCQ